jgi:hypothetical protein
VLTNLLHNNIAILSVLEYDYSPYNCFSGMEEFEKGKHRIKKFENKIPIVYAVVGEG